MLSIPVNHFVFIPPTPYSLLPTPYSLKSWTKVPQTFSQIDSAF
ncbi:hypothetical protein [Moorena sp. SIOASIH]|nr:hypothetical protein [Moorena sp. SIOASIH]